MSLDPILWAMKDAPVANVEEWAVLATYAERADEDGCHAYPSVKTVAKRTRLSPDTVRRRVRDMQNRGLMALGDQAAAAWIAEESRPKVYDLRIPLGWFPNLERIQQYRAEQGRPPLTEDDRPAIAPAPDRKRRKDFGTKRPKKSQDGGVASSEEVAPSEDLAPSEDPATSPETPSLEATQPSLLTNSPHTNPSSSAADAADDEADEGEPREDVEELCTLLADLMEGNGCKRPTVTKAWRTAARLMLDRDGRELAKARELLKWTANDPFWAPNVQSMPTFRKQYDRLRMRAVQEWEQSRQQNGGVSRNDQAVARTLSRAALYREAEDKGLTGAAVFEYARQRMSGELVPAGGAQ
jgi:hypothetical protein